MSFSGVKIDLEGALEREVCVCVDDKHDEMKRDKFEVVFG